MGCDDNYYLVDNPDRPDWMRREALCNLVRDGCVAHLYQLADNPDRPDWLRYSSIAALAAFAQCGGTSVSVTASTVSVGGQSISLTSLSIDLSSVGRLAVDALIAGRWSRQCLALADNPDRPDWMRKLAMKGL